jgi:rubredoxin
MQMSEWKCPICKQKLFITNGADYHCPDCNTWPKPDFIDPMGRDLIRNGILLDALIERTYGLSFERQT